MNTLLSRIFTLPFLVTLLRYGLAAAGAWLVANGMLDEGTWEIVGGSILTIVVALMGGADAVKDKAVVDGKAVALEKLPPSVRNPLEAAVPASRGRSLIDILTGK
jgi:hypothetical protein